MPQPTHAFQLAPRPSARPHLPSLALGAIVTLALLGLIRLTVWAHTEQPVGWQFAAAAPAEQATTGDKGPATLRVAGFNIQQGRGLDGRRDLDRTAAELDGFDVIFLSEIDYTSGQAQALARRLDMRLTAAPTERVAGDESFGNALLTARALPPPGVSVIPLPWSGDHGHRNAVLARLDLGGGRVLTLLGTHVASPRRDSRQVAAVLELFESLDEPAVLVGDLNTRHAHPRLSAMLGRADVQSAAARDDPAVGPNGPIDWLLLRGGGEAAANLVDGGLRKTDASDHPVVWAEVAIDGGGE